MLPPAAASDLLDLVGHGRKGFVVCMPQSGWRCGVRRGVRQPRTSTFIMPTFARADLMTTATVRPAAARRSPARAEPSGRRR